MEMVVRGGGWLALSLGAGGIVAGMDNVIVVVLAGEHRRKGNLPKAWRECEGCWTSDPGLMLRTASETCVWRRPHFVWELAAFYRCTRLESLP